MVSQSLQRQLAGSFSMLRFAIGHAVISWIIVAYAVPPYEARRLAQGDGCNRTASTWSFDVCKVATDELGSSLPMPPAGSMPFARPGMASAQAAFASGGNVMPVMAAVSGGGTIGFATGGAQDVENFRENIEEGYLPLPTDITYGGIVKSYYFDTSPSEGVAAPCQDLFCPVYSAALAPDPLLRDVPNSSDIFLAVGLDSGMQAAKFRRPRLNLVLLLDVSGSMGSPFDEYYYDSGGVRRRVPEEERGKSKMDVAKEVLVGVLGKLAPDDSVAIVLFTDDACTPKPLGPVSCVDMAGLKAGIQRDVTATSGTNLQSGLDQASSVLRGCRSCMDAGLEGVENRIILITDAQPNSGDLSTEGLGARLKANAADTIFTTLVGVGLDFNTELVEAIGKVKGANYFSVHTPGEFQERIADQFDYAVTPLVFDLSLAVDPASLAQGEGEEGWRILHVYGSPNPNDTARSSDGTIMRLNTLFPSPKTEEGIKGGVVLLRMKAPPTGVNTSLTLTVSYEDRGGSRAKAQRTVQLPAQPPPAADGRGVFQSYGVRKAVLLARYTDMLQGWLLDQWAREEPDPDTPVVIPLTLCSTFPQEYCPLPAAAHGAAPADGGCVLDTWLFPGGCVLPPPWPVFPPLLGRWERRSRQLAVNPSAQEAFSEFLPFMEAEVAAVGDATLGQEVQIINTLVATPDEPKSLP